MMDQMPCDCRQIRFAIFGQGEERGVQGGKNKLAEEIIEDNDQRRWATQP